MNVVLKNGGDWGAGRGSEGIKQEWVYCSVGPEKKAVRRVEEAAMR